MEVKSNEMRTAEYLKQFNRARVLRHLVTHDCPIIFDVGSNDGGSVIEFREIWPAAEIHCFEPQHECLEKLRANIASDSAGKIFLNEVAVGSTEAKRVEFYTHNITTGQAGFHKINENSVDSLNINSLSNDPQKYREYISGLNQPRYVNQKRLDSYMRDRQFETIDLIKIDTQGHEPEVLEGCGDKLKTVRLVLCELMFYDFYERSVNFTDIEKFLLPAGFKLYDISHISKNPMNGRTDWIDVIYLNRGVEIE